MQNNQYNSFVFFNVFWDTVYNCVLTDVLAGELSSVLNSGLSGLGSTDDSYNFATDFL